MARTTGEATWLEYNSTDFAASKDFYTGLFGWTFEDCGEAMGHYVMVRNGDSLVGGAMDVAGMTCPEGGEVPTCWSVYLAVDDLDARVAKVTEHGGRVWVQPMDVEGAGRMSWVADPNGAAFGLWQAGGTDGYDFTGQPGSPVWFELMTYGFDAAQEFYRAVLDVEFTAMEGGDGEDHGIRYSTNGAGDDAQWGMCDATTFMPEDATGWRIYLGVEATDAALAKIEALGGKLLDGPEDSPFGRICTVADPQGATFQICAMSEATQS